MEIGGTEISRATRFPAERRKATRYRLIVPVVFSWESSEHDRFQGEGSTRDISTVGAYILTPTSPPVDAPVNVEIMISALFWPTMVRIKGSMHVQRIRHELTKQGQSGFSVVGERFELYADLENESESEFDTHDETNEVRGAEGVPIAMSHQPRPLLDGLIRDRRFTRLKPAAKPNP